MTNTNATQAATSSPALSVTATPTMILEPFKWAAEARTLAADYEGLPEAPIFVLMARRFLALGAALPSEPDKDFDGMVIGGDID